MLQRRADIRHHEDVVEIEPTAERNQGDEAAMKSAQREALNPGRNRMVSAHRRG